MPILDYLYAGQNIQKTKFNFWNKNSVTFPRGKLGENSANWSIMGKLVG